MTVRYDLHGVTHYALREETALSACSVLVTPWPSPKDFFVVLSGLEEKDDTVVTCMMCASLSR